MTSQGTILVVDDHRLNRVVLSTSLQADGYTVEMAENGRQALERLGIQPFDVVLLDLLMPGDGRLSGAGKMKASPTGATFPVSIVSVTG